MRSPFSAVSTPILIIPRTNRSYSLRCMYIARVFFPADKSTHVALGRHAQTCGRLGFCLFLLLAKELLFVTLDTETNSCASNSKKGVYATFHAVGAPVSKTSSYATVIELTARSPSVTSRALENLRMHSAQECYPQEKWPTRCLAKGILVGFLSFCSR